MSTYFVEVESHRQIKNRAESEVMALIAYHSRIINSEKEKNEFMAAVISYVDSVNNKYLRCRDISINTSRHHTLDLIFIGDVCRVSFQEINGIAKWDQEKMNELIKNI